MLFKLLFVIINKNFNFRRLNNVASILAIMLIILMRYNKNTANKEQVITGIMVVKYNLFERMRNDGDF